MLTPRLKINYNQMYGLGKHGRFNAQQMQIENPDMSPAEIVGNMKADMVSDIDPLADLFG